MSMASVTEIDTQYNLHPWLPAGIETLSIKRGDGVYFWDYQDKQYIDMCSQMGNVNLGYGNENIIKAVQEQIEVLPYVAAARSSAPAALLAEQLVSLAPDNIGKVFFSTGGSDANEAAINIARTYTGRQKILSMYRSYHGSTLGSGNLSGDVRRFALERPAAPGFIKFFNPYTYKSCNTFSDDAQRTHYYLNLLEEQILYEGPDEIAAIEVEAVVGANGVLIPPDGYLQGLYDLTRKYGILLICDEVMAGFYRTGTLFSFEHWGIKPDLISFAKGVTSGYVPLGGVLISKEIAKFYEDTAFQYGLTYSGHALSCSAGLGALKAYEELNIVKKVSEAAKIFAEKLDELASEYDIIGEVRHIGLFGAIELAKDKKTREPLAPFGNDVKKVLPGVQGILLQHGIATMGRESTLVLAPPLIISEKELDEAFIKIQAAFVEIQKVYGS
ncbi:MAG: aminotransferase class III-fold pyridoxal phosphate-dependent enzyme [Eggerthellaceae bacterium]|nr:aminotransferase class III-fold pyridoxal phosphate-dependent enzyme [Eggerthellaceae bacterium]